MPLTGRRTLTQYLIEQRRRFPQASGDFNALILDVAMACKAIARAVAFGALGDMLGNQAAPDGGEGGSVNVQGETQKKLDVLSNEYFVRITEWGGHLGGMASEEMDLPYQIPAKYPRGKYLLVFDPLDGSSNIDVNVPVGTIFSVFRKITRGTRGEMEDMLQPGRRQVAAGYILYGSSTMMVYTTGQGAHGFTLDPSIGEFLLSHPNIRIPERARYLSVNDAYEQDWPEPTRALMRRYRGLDGQRKALNVRYVGSLVADFHRNLLGGGVFCYPANGTAPRGKLRLLYEANPLAFIAEQAGGLATDGYGSILDIEPTELHQRSPLYIGSKTEVELVRDFPLPTDVAPGIPGRRDSPRAAPSPVTAT